MTTHLSDEQLAGYVLNELPEDERRAVEQALGNDPELQERLRDFEWAAQCAQDVFCEGREEALTEAQRETILREAHLAGANAKAPRTAIFRKVPWPRWRVLLPLAAGVLVLLGGFSVLRGSMFGRIPGHIEQHDLKLSMAPAQLQQQMTALGYLGNNRDGEPAGNDGVVSRMDFFGIPQAAPEKPKAEPAAAPASLQQGAYSYDVNGDGATEATSLYSRSGQAAKSSEADTSNTAGAASKAATTPIPAQDTQPDRYLIKTATLTIEAEDVKQATSQISAAATAAGGYVSDMRESVDPYGRANATIIVRMPVEKLDSTLHGVEALGRVISSQVTAEDVTEDYVDTDARINNLKKTEERLVDHLSKTSSIENTLKIEQEMTRVRGELERLQGHMRFMSHRIAYSTIQVTITEKPKAGPVTPPETFSSASIATQALISLVRFGEGLWTKIIWYAVWSPVWGLVLLIAWLVYRKIRKALR